MSAFTSPIPRPLSGLALAGLLACTLPDGDPTPVPDRGEPMSEMAARFDTWLEAHVRAEVPGAEHLYYAYYDVESAEPWLLSLPISADVVRFHLQHGQLERAVATGEALLVWQHDGTSGPRGARLRGAFPSAIEVEPGGRLTATWYDSVDNVTIIEALLDLHAATGESAYATSAIAAGVWLRDVMSRGDAFGVWLERLPGTMRGATDRGDFDNRIPVGRTLFWLPTLHRLARISGDASFARLAEDAAAFLMIGQRSEGGFHDHYDPQWPPQPFDEAHFDAYGIDGSIFADDSLRAALGAVAAGDTAAARAFAAWLPADDRIAGYLDLVTGAPLFVPQDPVYYDIIASALYRDLAEALDLPADGAVAFVRETQADNGGWYWGWHAAEDRPLNQVQATLTGLGAVMTLGPRR